MEPESLSVEVQTLLRERIGSYEQLHVLLLLFKQRKEWSEDEITTEVRISRSEVAVTLSALVANQLISPSSAAAEAKYRYLSGAHDAVVEELVRSYHERPIAIIRLLAGRSIERIRADALRAFADAFLFRKR